MAKKRKTHRRKATRSSGHSLFKIAARDKSYKSAKRAKSKAESRTRSAWRKALVKAKKKLKKMRHC